VPLSAMRGTRGLLVVVAAASFLLTLFTLLQYTSSLGKRMKMNFPSELAQEKKNIFFLKAHKCASSTVQNILMRYGVEEGLDLALPKTGNYLGNPVPFNRSMIPKELSTPDGKYNIFTHHTRYNRGEMEAVLRTPVVFVTILRDPADLYESLYSFYRLDTKHNLTLAQVISKKTVPSQLKKRMLGKIGLNQMCWDLGLQEDAFLAPRRVEAFVRRIEKEFHLVMISEYMEASLVLLARLMGWPLNRVAFLKLNARPDSRKIRLGPKDRDTLLQLNAADAHLYDHFLGVFKKRVEEYGIERLEADVRELNRLNNELWRKCVVGTSKKGYAFTTSYELRPNAEPLCHLATKLELTFTEEIRRQQMSFFKSLNALDSLVPASGRPS